MSSSIKLFNSLGEEIDLSSLGLVGLKLNIPSPSYRVTSENIDGRAGETIIEKTLNSRSLTAEFFVKSLDYLGSLEVRDQLFEIFGNGQTLYISESYLPTRRWMVHADGWTPERINRTVSRFEIPLLAESGTAESVNLIEKTFSTLTFPFKNEGNVLVDPCIHSETEIEFKGASSNLVVRNLTTSDEWSWTGSTIIGDTILLKGVRSFKNDVSIFGQTNKKLITLVPDWNDFQIIGATGLFEINIRTRFYFL
jgi:hypothetical protein